MVAENLFFKQDVNVFSLRTNYREQDESSIYTELCVCVSVFCVCESNLCLVRSHLLSIQDPNKCGAFLLLNLFLIVLNPNKQCVSMIK